VATEAEALKLGSLTKDEINHTVQASFSLPAGGSINVYAVGVENIEAVKSKDFLRELLLNAATSL